MTAQVLEQQPTLDSLERQQLVWQQRQIVATTWLNVLTERASLLQDMLNRLSELNKTWSATRAAAQTANAPEPILEQIDETLTTIAAETAPIESQRTTVLDLQARVAKVVARCAGVPLRRSIGFSSGWFRGFSCGAARFGELGSGRGRGMRRLTAYAEYQMESSRKPLTTSVTLPKECRCTWDFCWH
jgi:hypothetical protein